MNKLSLNLNRTGIESLLLFLIRACIVLVVLTPLLVTSDPFPQEIQTFFPFIVGKALYSRLMILISVTLWLILIINRAEYRPKQSWLISVFTIFLLASLLASLLGVGPTRSFWSTFERMQGMVDLMHWFAFVLVFVSVFREIASMRRVLQINILVSLIVALLGVAQKYGIEVPGFPYLMRDGLLRVDSTLGNPTFIGAYLMVSILLAGGFLSQSLRKLPALNDWNKVYTCDAAVIRSLLAPAIWITVIGFNFWVLTLTGARGALFGLAAGLLLCLFIYLFKDNNKLVRLAVAIILAFILAVSLLFVFARNSSFVETAAQQNRMVAMLATLGSEEDSYSIRREIINVGLKSFAQRPLLGWGPDNFYVAYDYNVTADSFSKMAVTVDQPHNKVIEELATKGIMGFIPYIAMWMLIGVVYIRYLRDKLNIHWDLAVFLAAASVGYFVQNLFLFDTASTSLQFYLLLSAAVLFEQVYEKQDMVTERPGVSTRLIFNLDIIKLGFNKRSGFVSKIFSNSVSMFRMPEFHVPVIFALFILVYIFSIHFPYSASHHTKKAIEQRLTSIERMYEYDLAIKKFPALGTYPRIYLFMFLSNEWKVFNDDEKTAAIYLAKKHFTDAIKVEPRNWRIYLGACRVYQSASFEYPELLALCSEYLDKVDMLAPERIETYEARARQYLLEGNITAAQSTLNEYLEMNPNAKHLLEQLINIAFTEEVN